jgi:hypothetical protein
MTGRRLTELFAEVAEDVPAPALARTAWETARRARRRHRIAGAGAVAGVVAAALGVAGTLTAGGGPIAVPTGTPDVSVPANPRPSPLSANVDGLPDRLRTATTDRLAPEVPDFDTVDVDGLSQHPGRTAVALYEKMPDEQATQPKDVYAWLDDGSWARLDQVRLRFGRDADGNQHNPLDTTSLSADGRYAAFAQPDEVVVVTIATGAVDRIPLPGYNEHVTWHGPGQLFVAQDQTTYRLDLASRQYVRVGVSGWDLAAGNDPAARVIELPQTNRDSGKLIQREWTPDGSASLRTTPLNSTGVTPYGIDEWYGRGWRHGDLVVRAGFGYAPRVQGIDTVVALDVRTGAVIRLLALDIERWKGCCEPIGWLDDATVLLRVNPDGVVAWNVRTGAMTQVAPPFRGTIAPASR